jgi:hypothetical protein
MRNRDGSVVTAYSDDNRVTVTSRLSIACPFTCGLCDINRAITTPHVITVAQDLQYYANVKPGDNCIISVKCRRARSRDDTTAYTTLYVDIGNPTFSARRLCVAVFSAYRLLASAPGTDRYTQLQLSIDTLFTMNDRDTRPHDVVYQLTFVLLNRKFD